MEHEHVYGAWEPGNEAWIRLVPRSWLPPVIRSGVQRNQTLMGWPERVPGWNCTLCQERHILVVKNILVYIYWNANHPSAQQHWFPLCCFVWQSSVEIKNYSVPCFACTTVFKEQLYRRTFDKSRSHQHFVNNTWNTWPVYWVFMNSTLIGSSAR